MKKAVIFLMCLFVFSCNKEETKISAILQQEIVDRTDVSETKINRRTLIYGFDTNPESTLEPSKEELEKKAEAVRLEGIMREERITQKLASMYPHMYDLNPEYLIGTWFRIDRGMFGYTVFEKEYVEIGYEKKDNTYYFNWYLQPENPFCSWFKNKPVSGVLEYENDKLTLKTQEGDYHIFITKSRDPDNDGSFSISTTDGLGEPFGFFQRKEILEEIELVQPKKSVKAN